MAPPPKVPAHAATEAELNAATVFGAPQLRDLKKEATAFVPTSIKRKKAGPAGSGSSSRIDAAPSFGPTATEEEVTQDLGPVRPDLLSVLKSQFGPVPAAAPASSAVAGKGDGEVVKKKDDYEKFVEEIGNILT